MSGSVPQITVNLTSVSNSGGPSSELVVSRFDYGELGIAGCSTRQCDSKTVIDENISLLH